MNGARTRSNADRVPDRTQRKALRCKGLNAVNDRPWSDRTGQSEARQRSSRQATPPSSMPLTVSKNCERGQGQITIVTAFVDRTRETARFAAPYAGFGNRGARRGALAVRPALRGCE